MPTTLQTDISRNAGSFNTQPVVLWAISGCTENWTGRIQARLATKCEDSSNFSCFTTKEEIGSEHQSSNAFASHHGQWNSSSSFLLFLPSSSPVLAKILITFLSENLSFPIIGMAPCGPVKQVLTMQCADGSHYNKTLSSYARYARDISSFAHPRSANQGLTSSTNPIGL